MNSIEITNAINAKGYVEPSAAELAEAKAKHWIRLGVKAALHEAVLLAKCDLLEAKNAAIDFGGEADIVVEELEETLRLLETSQLERRLTNTGWALRKENK